MSFFTFNVAIHFTKLKLFNFEKVPYLQKKTCVKLHGSRNQKGTGSCNTFPKSLILRCGVEVRYLGLGGHFVLAERNDDLEVVPVVQLDVPATRLHQHLLNLANDQFS
jgi:hypothetical protein